jgi:hypothetical protein
VGDLVKRSWMMRATALALISPVVAGCVSSQGPRDLFSIPVTGQLSNGLAASGQATARSDGRGTFWVQFPAGPRCSGDYNVRDPNPTIVVPVSCTDGRRGETVITRQAGLMSGTAIVALNDRTRGQFVFGDLTFSQAFGSGGMARTR